MVIEPGFRAAASIPPGFEPFFRHEHDRLQAVAYALTGRRDAAEDAVQEAMLRALRDWPHVSRLDRPGAWARRVVVNLCTDLHRRRVRHDRALERYGPPSFDEMPEPTSARLWAAVRELPGLQRAVVVLHHVDDLSVSEVARVLDVSVGTVKTSLSRARTRLANQLRMEDLR